MATNDLQWTTIEDFSPGIYSAPGTRSPLVTGFSGIRPFAPLGSCTDASYGCLPGPGGRSLIPGFYTDTSEVSPGRPAFQQSDMNDANAPTNGPYIVNGYAAQNYGGLMCHHVCGVLYRANTTNFMTLKLFRALGNVATTDIMRTLTSANTTKQYAGMTFAFTRMDTASPYTAAGQPVVAWGYGGNYTTMGEAGVFPDPTAPTVTASAVFTDKGLVFAHQNRVLLLVADGNAFYSFGNSQNISTSYERLDFTDPANSNVMGTQRQTFYPEDSSGYAAWASLSASSLFMVKRTGGAVLFEGDFKAPRVTVLPGVQSTGDLMTIACASRVGVVYGSKGAGLWAWQGGATAVKISQQLDDNFWRHNQPDTIEYFDRNDNNGSVIVGPSLQVLPWNDYLFVSGGWIHHIPTGGWWRLDDSTNSSKQYLWYGIDQSIFQNYSSSSLRVPFLYATHPVMQQSGSDFYAARRYNLGKYASSWLWRSTRIRPPETRPSKNMGLKEVVVVAQRDASASGNATIQVKTYKADSGTVVNTTAAQTIPTAANAVALRFLVDINAESCSVEIIAANSSDGQPAPIVHSIHLGWQEQNLLKANI